MSQNQILFVDWLTTEGLRILVNKLAVAKYMNTDYNREWKRSFAVGETVRVPLPIRGLIRNGAGYDPQALNEKFTTITIDQMFGMDFEYDTLDQALKMPGGDGKEWIKKKILNSYMAQIAQNIDSLAAMWVKNNANNFVGVLGTNATSMDTYQAARQRYIENAGIQDGKICQIVTPGMNRAVANALATVFNPRTVSEEIFAKGYLGTEAAGADWYESMSCKQHTAGTWQGAVTVNGANQSGSSLAISATAGDTFKVGDVIVIGVAGAAGAMYNVNPETRDSTGQLKQLVVTAPLTALGGGNAADVLQISPAIVGPNDPYQNVDSLPITGTALTLFLGTPNPNGKSGSNGIYMHRDAFMLAAVKLYEPKAVEMASTDRDEATGVSVRFVQQFDAVQSRLVNRFDVLMGFGNGYADQLAVRVGGQ